MNQVTGFQISLVGTMTQEEADNELNKIRRFIKENPNLLMTALVCEPRIATDKEIERIARFL